MTTDLLNDLEARRKHLTTASGPASVLDTGGPGPATLLVHGVATNAFLWRHVIHALAERRRCIAVDLPLHGHTPMTRDQDVSLPGLATFVADCCDALGLDTVDVVANDTGGAVAQVFAAHHSDRLRSLTLTNCETHDNVPPRVLLPSLLLARLGLLSRLMPRLLHNTGKARKFVFGSGYQNVERLPEAVVRSFLDPVFGTREKAALLERWMLSIRAQDLLDAEPRLRRLRVPTLIVWGTNDVFFHRRWAQWLHDTIPGAEDVVYLDGARLFFPDERAGELVGALNAFWGASRVSPDS